jgi:predicted GNAT family acetyltransferase
MTEATIETRDVPERRRYEITLDGEVAGVAYYSVRDGEITLKHTEVDDRFEGRGLGSRLARTVLDEARARGLKVVPLCPFMAGYIHGHAEYQDLVQVQARNPSAST